MHSRVLVLQWRWKDVKCKDSKKEITDLELEYPQTVAQSYKVLENNS